MLQAVNSISGQGTPCGSDHKGGKRKPLQILTGIFSRKGSSSSREMSFNTSSEGKDSFFLPDEGDLDIWEIEKEIPEPREALHSPYHARTIDQDMQNLRLSRQDNPFLQILASRECLNESDDGSEYEEKNLMSKENLSGSSRDPLSLEEVHARLVRSPPPVMWTRSRNSEPSFSLLTSSHHSHGMDSDLVFRFPPHDVSSMLTVPEPSPTLSSRSHGNVMGQNRFSKNQQLDLLAGKFNLSPQPRRRSMNKPCPFPGIST